MAMPFSSEIKPQVMESIRDNLGKIDFLVYSIAAPRRLDPQTGELYSSVIKTWMRSQAPTGVIFSLSSNGSGGFGALGVTELRNSRACCH